MLIWPMVGQRMQLLSREKDPGLDAAEPQRSQGPGQLSFRLNNWCNYRILCLCEAGARVSLGGGLGWACYACFMKR